MEYTFERSKKTEVIKQYGIYGYLLSAGCYCYGEFPDINELLYLKSYALKAYEVRDIEKIKLPGASPFGLEKTSFEKELEILLFDM